MIRLSVSLALAVILAQMLAFSALAADRLIAIYVSPPKDDIAAGTVFDSGDFLFVPDETTVVLLDESGQRYLIEGKAALILKPEKLAAFRHREGGAQPATALEFIFGADPVNVIAAGRVVPKTVDDRGHPAGRLSVELLAGYALDGRFCLTGESLILRRAVARKDDFVILADSKEQRIVEWPAGAHELVLDRVRPDDGSVQQVSLKTSRFDGSLELHPVPEDLLEQEPAIAAAILARKKCTLQALIASRKLVDRANGE